MGVFFYFSFFWGALGWRDGVAMDGTGTGRNVFEDVGWAYD